LSTKNDEVGASAALVCYRPAWKRVAVVAGTATALFGVFSMSNLHSHGQGLNIPPVALMRSSVGSGSGGCNGCVNLVNGIYCPGGSDISPSIVGVTKFCDDGQKPVCSPSCSPSTGGGQGTTSGGGDLQSCKTLCPDVTAVPKIVKGTTTYTCNSQRCSISDIQEKEKFIKLFGQDQYDCTTCGLHPPSDGTCPSKCRELKGGNTGMCIVGVKGVFKWENPTEAPPSNVKAEPPIRSHCCVQATQHPKFTSSGACYCESPYNLDCVLPCGEGGPCFATGNPAQGCAFKGGSDGQCNKQQF